MKVCGQKMSPQVLKTVIFIISSIGLWGRRYRMVLGFTTNYTISAHHH